jgi:hypothetical protein
MKKMIAKMLILGGLLLSASLASPLESQRFDGGGPKPTCDPVPTGCPGRI